MDRIWFDKQGIGWTRVVRLAAIWAAVVAVIVFLDRDPTARPPAPAGAATSAAPQPAPVVLAISPTPVSLPRPADLAASTATGANAKTVVNCQTMPVERDATGKTLEDRMAEMDVSAQRKAIVERMGRSPSEWHRAAALLLEPTSETVAEAACDKAACDAKARSQDALNRLDMLARLASSTADPQVYALAFHACNKEPLRQRGTCQLISADQWARLDAGNASPWLYKMDEAARANDLPAQVLALNRIAEAQRNDSGIGVVGGAVAAHAGDGEAHQVAALQLLTDALGIQAAWTAPRTQPLQALCAPAMLADPSRRHLCNSAGEAMIGKSGSLADRHAALAFATKLGWPPEQMLAIRVETDALHGALALASRPTGAAPSACTVLKETISTAKRIGELGEIGAARQLARDSGRSMAQLAKEQAARVAELGKKMGRKEGSSAELR